jgi:hypothetical protein
MTQHRSDFVARPGGVMTDEVGTVTGELTLLTEQEDDGTVRVLVQYLGADEWYRVTNSPTSLPADTSLQALHERLVHELGA